MGLMEEGGRLVVTPHPVTLEGQRNVAAELVPGESLADFLARAVPEELGHDWEVRINGVVVPHELMPRVRPKNGTVIEVRGLVREQALYIVAMVALTYFTFGIGSAAGWGAGAAAAAFGGGVAGALFATAVFIGGSILINKALGPKAPGARNNDPDSVYSLSGARNTVRQYQPVPLLFGVVRITPDIASTPYTWFEGNDQHFGMVLNAGINVDRVESLSNGDTLLSVYEGAAAYYSGFPGMPEQEIPLYSNADVINGGELDKEGTWVTRTTPLDTVRVQIDIEYILGDVDSKGRDYYNRETVVAERRETGTTNWSLLATRALANNNYDTKRMSIAVDVTRGQYDIRVRRLGQAFEEKNGRAQFSWNSLTAVQADDADYAGLSRIGIRVKATGQLNGAMDELRCIAHARSVQLWNGAGWTTATTRAEGLSNPGAQILAYARGFRDQNGRLIAGLGIDDAQIDLEALKGFMLHCTANAYTFDAYVKSARSHDDMLQAIALAGFAQVTWSAGRLSVAWASAAQPLAGVVNMATIKKGQFQVDYTLADAADGIEYTYLDRTDWQAKTLRVPAPGVETMLNPAQVSGEGISDEAHAVRLARYHLAQSIYQFKDISYSTDLEHLSYRRLDMLALQHDLTQWGHGGRVVSASTDAGVTTLVLDEPVPAPSSGTAFMGVRIPGEKVYRVFPVTAFAGTTDTVTLAEPWPVDAPLPGSSASNPAHDSIWIYDFKQTPGYRVRVVGIEPESDLKGARVAVVPESAEFWTYVHTGVYEPPANPQPNLTRPIASNLAMTERQVVQGDTTYTDLQASFDVTGPMAYAVVHAAPLVDGVFQELVEVAQTSTRTASWRIPAAGTYAVVVRPYNADGIVGTAATGAYTTGGAELPPPPFDFFMVTELDGGVRKFVWGYEAETTQPADLAGAEIRYIAGADPEAEWAAMQQLGSEGYFTGPVELVIPPAGTWTFACRARNTAGQLSTPVALVVTLTENLGEIIDGINGELANWPPVMLALEAAIAQEIVDRQEAIAQEEIDRTAAIAAEAAARAADILAASESLGARIDTEEMLREGADEMLALAISTISAGTGEQFDVASIWYFDGQLEAWTTNAGAPTLSPDGFLVPPPGNPLIFMSPAGDWGDPTHYKNVKARVRRVGEPSWQGLITASTDFDTFDFTAAEPVWNDDGIAVVNWSDLAWSGAAVTELQITFANGTTDAQNRYELDWIAVGRSSPGASVAALQTEQSARISGDAAEATSRETLAAQLRGGYAGTDPTALVSGLIYNERQLQLGANSAMASQISALDVRLGKVGGNNLLLNSSFERDTDGDGLSDSWVAAGLSGNPARLRFASVVANSTMAQRLQLSLSNTEWQQLYSGAGVQAQPGKEHVLSAWVRGTTGTALYAIVQWVASNGSVVRTDEMLPETMTGTTNAQWRRIIWPAMAAVPTSVVTAVVIFRQYGPNGGKTTCTLDLDNVMLQIGTVATDYVANTPAEISLQASATSALTARVEDTEEGLTATANDLVSLDARVDSAETAISGHGTAISNLNTTVSEQGGAISAVSGSLTSLTGRVDGAFATGAGWVFTGNGDTLGWTFYNVGVAMFPPEATVPALAFGSTAADPNMTSPLFSINGAANPVIRMRVRRRTNTPWEGAIFWATTNHGISGSYMTLIESPVSVGGSNENYEIIEVDMSSIPDWTGSTIRQIRFDPINDPGGTVDIHWIAIGNPNTPASSAAAQRVLETRVTATEAVAADVTTLRSELVGALIAGKNLLMNPTGARGTAGWRLLFAGTPAATFSGPGSYLRLQNGTSNELRTVIQDYTNAQVAQKRFTFSGELYVAGLMAGGNVLIDIVGLDANGAGVWIPGSAVTVTANQGYAAFAYVAPSVSSTAVVTLRARIRVNGTFTDIRWRNAKLEWGASATAFTDDQVYSSATQILTTSVTQLETGQAVLMASASVALDVNGYVTGYKLNNDGTTGEMTIVADRFRIVTPGSSPVTPFALTANNLFLNANLNMGVDRVIVNRRAGFMSVIGNGFGTAGQFLEWFGPEQASVNSCSESNAISYLKTNGSAYFGGTLAAGTLRNAVQSTQTYMTGNEVINGPFGTNGNPRTVTISYSRTVRRIRAASGSTGYTAGAGSNTARVRVYRSINGAAETLWQTLNCTGDVQILNESDGPDQATLRWYGSMTVNDQSPAGQTVRYRLYIDQESTQTVTHSSGLGDSNVITDASLANISIEQ